MKVSVYGMFLALLAALVMGCGSGDDFSEEPATNRNPLPVAPRPTNPDPDPTPGDDTPTEAIRFINMFAGATGLLVQIDGVPIDSDLQLAEATDYVGVVPATHTVSVLLGNTTLLTEQVAVGEDQFITLVIQGDGSVNARGVQAQTTSDDIDFLVLTDDVTPDEGQFNARLVNSTPEPDYVCTLLTNDNQQLLGPVAALQAGPYSAQNLQTLQNATSLVLFFESQTTNPDEVFEFFEAQGSGAGLVESIIAQIPVEGVNATILTTTQDDTTQFLLVVIDDASDGNVSIVSTDSDNNSN